VRRLKRKLEAKGDGAYVHGQRGRPSNHCHKPTLRKKVIRLYRKKYTVPEPGLGDIGVAGLVVTHPR